MNINRTWSRRLTRTGQIGAGAVAVLVVGGSAISGIDTVWHWISPRQPPPIADISRQIINQTDPVKAFAEHCVTAILTATTATAKNLGGCVPNPQSYSFQATTTAAASEAHATDAKLEGSVGGAELYGVKVAVNQRPYASAPWSIEFYSIPIAVTDNSMAALDRISRVTPPPAGQSVPLGYGAQVKVDSKLHGILAGFVTAFLANTGDLERYITTDSGISVLGGYAKDATRLTAAQSDADPPDNPADNTELAAHVEVTATRADRSRTDQLAYALTLRSIAGAWFVARIDAIPVIAADTTPATTPHRTKEGN